MHRNKMPGIRGIMSGARSMRIGRTTGGSLSESSKQNIQQSHSDPLALQRVNTDDSSVFSGLASVHTRVDDDENKSIKSVRFHDEVPSEIKASGGKKSMKRKPIQRFSQGKAGMVAHQSISENDEVSIGYSTNVSYATEENEIVDGHENSIAPTASCSHDSSTSSYASSVNDFQRPKATMRLLSDIQLTDIENSQDQGKHESNEPSTPDGAEAIKNMLEDFSRELDESMMDIHDDDYTAVEMQQDILARRVPSSENFYDSSSEGTKLLQINLHQLRKEMRALRENNDQFLSEIEQTKEEHESEMKLYDERMKQRFFELKLMHQEEIELLVQEKDAAIAEAGRQAIRYADSGKEQIASLQKQITKLKQHMKKALRKAVDDATTTTKRQKEQEITSRLSALRTSYESKLEKLKAESEDRMKSAVREAVTDVTKQILGGQKPPGMDDEAWKRMIKQSEFGRNEETLLNALQSVSDNLSKHYPQQIKDLRERSHPNALVLLLRGQNETCTEKLFREVVETFGFLLENAESNAVKDRIELCAKSKQDRLELDYVKTQAEAARIQSENDRLKIERLEQELKLMTKEKRFIQERYRRDAESHRMESENLKKEIGKLQGGFVPAQPDENTLCREDTDDKMDASQHSSDNFSVDMKIAISDDCCDEVESLRSPLESPLHGLGIQRDYPQRSGSNDRPEGQTRQRCRRGDGTNDLNTPEMVSISVSNEYPNADRVHETSSSEPTKQEELLGEKRKQKKKKSFAILRGFKASRGNPPVVEDTFHQQEHCDTEQRPSTRTTSMIRTFLDTLGRTDSFLETHGSCSDESVSSLKTYTGVDSLQEQSQSDPPLKVANADAIDGDDNAPLLTPVSNLKQTHSRTRKNPLGMFANRRKLSLSPEKKPLPEQDKSRTTTRFDSVERARSKSETEDSDTAESSRRHKTPFPGFDSLKHNRKETPISDVIDGRKPPLAEWTADNAITASVHIAKISNDDITVPSSIDVHQNATKAHLTKDSDIGHTMCLRPLPVESKSHSDSVSLITEESQNQVVTNPSKKNQEAGSKECSSQAHMRKLPPLGDQSDDESHDESIDKYQNFEGIESENGHETFSRPTLEKRSAKDHMHHPASKPILVQGDPFSRKTNQQGLFSRKASDFESASEATTTITAHTFRSSFTTQPSKLRDLADNSSSALMRGSSKREAVIASLKARRARRVGEV